LDACYNEHDVALIVENVPFNKLEKLKSQIMENVRGSLRVSQKSFLRGRAELAIGWQNCNTQRLAQMLDGLLIDKDRLQVLEARGNSIRVSYVKK
jgi:hypothetical protein